MRGKAAYIPAKLIIIIACLLSLSIFPASADIDPDDFNEADAVQLMLEEINVLRGEAGLKLLALDPNLSDVARGHSSDMAAREFFGHLDPDGRDANDRVRKAGLGYIVGENVGVYRTNEVGIERVVFDLMDSFCKSDSHRRNILNPNYTHVGIGFYFDESEHSSLFDDIPGKRKSDDYSVIFVTQNFYRQEIRETAPARLPELVAVGEELELSISTLDRFDTLSLQFAREGFFSEEYWVRTSAGEPNTYSCRLRFAEEGLWACKVVAVYDESRGLTRAIGQMEFRVGYPSF